MRMRLYDLYLAKYGNNGYEKGNVFVMRSTWNMIMEICEVSGLSLNEKIVDMRKNGTTLVITSAFRFGVSETYMVIPTYEKVDTDTGKLIAETEDTEKFFEGWL